MKKTFRGNIMSIMNKMQWREKRERESLVTRREGK